MLDVVSDIAWGAFYTVMFSIAAYGLVSSINDEVKQRRQKRAYMIRPKREP